MTKIKDIINYLEEVAPPSYQESYDNSGLIVGDPQTEINGILICLDSTEPILDEARQKNCNLIIAHHPIVFRGLKKFIGGNYVERVVTQAIKEDIALYAIHTNLDNIYKGVNYKLGEKIGLDQMKILAPKPDQLSKIISFVPQENTEEVLDALHQKGAGIIGNYDHCSFRVVGSGRFKPNEEAQPHIGAADKMESVSEDRIEVIFPTRLQDSMLKALQTAHPYEEPAYYLQSVGNIDSQVGAGMVGDLAKAMDQESFLKFLKERLELHCIRHTEKTFRKIKKVAICGGSGSFLLNKAIKSGADAYVSADFKYHEFFDADQKIFICDIGHYESEQYSKELIKEILSQKFTNIALNLSEYSTNPIRYF